MQPLDGLKEPVNIFDCRQDEQSGEQLGRTLPSGQLQKCSIEKTWAQKAWYKKEF